MRASTRRRRMSLPVTVGERMPGAGCSDTKAQTGKEHVVFINHKGSQIPTRSHPRTSMFIVALLAKAKTWEHPDHRWINE